LVFALVASCSSSSHPTRRSSAKFATSTTRAPRSSGCTRPPLAPGVSTRTLRSGGMTRTYQLTMPPGYTGPSPLPVVFALHALTVSYTVATALAGFGEAATHYTYIAVAPSGRLNGATPYWLAAPVADN